MSNLHFLKRLLQRYAGSDGRADGRDAPPEQIAGKTRDADGQQQSLPTNAPEHHDDLYDAVIGKATFENDHRERRARSLQHNLRRRR
jgi:hypothetical protein